MEAPRHPVRETRPEPKYTCDRLDRGMAICLYGEADFPSIRVHNA